jgi:hypothetical protein
MPAHRGLSEFTTRIRTGTRLLVALGAIILSFRPEGPAMNRPGRQAGIGIVDRWSAEGAAPKNSIVSRLRRSTHPLIRSRPDGRAYKLPALRTSKTIVSRDPQTWRTPEVIFTMRNYLRRSVHLARPSNCRQSAERVKSRAGARRRRQTRVQGRCRHGRVCPRQTSARSK